MEDQAQTVEALRIDPYLRLRRQTLSDCIQLAVAELDCSTVLLVIDQSIPEQVFPFRSAEFAQMRVARICAGEQRKQYALAAEFVQEHQDHLDKQSLVIAVGGGSLLDFVGFCCGVIYRGVRYISVPASVTAMADAAYGGKTAVSLGRGGAKNQIGVYHHPQRIFLDFQLLKSLPALHARAGMVEIAKLACFFPDIARVLDRVDMTRADHDPSTLAEPILAAAKKKLELVQADPFEESDAAPLLYGHAFSNAFESFAWEQHEKFVPHGMAVAMGICFSAFLAERLDKRFENAFVTQRAMVSRLVDLEAVYSQCVPHSADEMIALLLRDKYSVGQRIKVPALLGPSGYTQLQLDQVKQEFTAWRRAMQGSFSGHPLLPR